MKKTLLFFSLLMSTLLIKAQFGKPYEISGNTVQSEDVFGADLDNDGDIDIISASNGNSRIAWYENLGSGKFGYQNIVDNNFYQATSLFAIDLDGDSDVDIIAGGVWGAGWYENLGNGIFSDKIALSFSSLYIKSIYAIDIDSDGDNDVLLGSYNSDQIILKENQGGGIFNLQYISSSADGVNTVFANDIDGDGDIDILSASENDNTIAWYENMGGNVFSNEHIVSNTAGNVKDVYSEDLDGDGDNDIVSYTISDNTLGWYQNNGAGVFNPIVTIQVIPNVASIFISDFDNDGDQDILTGDDYMRWYENNGNATGWTTRFFTAKYGNKIAVIDVNGDGLKNIIYSTGWRGGVGWMGNGFDKIITVEMDGTKAICSGDFDGDGDIDAISITGNDNKAMWFENMFNGQFRYNSTLSTAPMTITGGDAGDIDGDDIADVVIIGSSPGLYYFKNQGNGTFFRQSISIPSGVAGLVKLVDIDGDNDLDIIVYSTWNVFWIENLGSGILGSPVNIANISTIAVDMECCDIDSDGDMDIIVADGSNGKIILIKNLGGGSFNYSNICTLGSINTLYPADIDGDGLLDIIAANNGTTLYWFKNNGATSFSNSPVISGWANGIKDVYAMDIDSDGDVDVFSAGGQELAWYENLGAGFFGGSTNNTQHIIDNQIISTGGNLISLADFDGDGDKEVFAADFPTSLYRYENFFINSYQLKGSIYFDLNQNKIKDINESGLSIIQSIVQPNSLFSYTDINGNYLFSVDSGNYSVGYTPDSLWNLTTDSVSYNSTITSTNPIINGLDFGFYPDTIKTIILPDLTGAFPRCNQLVSYWVNIHNYGTTIPSGIIHIQLDDSIDYISSIIVPDSINGQNIYWHYDSLFYFSNDMIKLEVLMPSSASAGSSLVSYVTVEEIDGGSNVIYSNNDSLVQILVCALDPNDKLVTPQGLGSEGYILNNQRLEYLIRFQNTGNDTAITVMVRDQLSQFLDWSSLQPISSSHPMDIRLEQDGEIIFEFKNIMLPDDNVNFSESQGFVKFSIAMNTNLAPGTPILNEGYIYFDYNPVVITNKVRNTIYDCNKTPIIVNSNIICFGEDLDGFSSEESFSSYLWEIDSFYSSTNESLNWISDTIGNFNLNLTITNEYCTKDTLISITVLPAIPLTSTSTSICQGDSIKIGGIFQSNSGVYFESLQSIFGCDSILSITLLVNPLPNVNMDDFLLDTICGNEGLITLPTGTPLGGSYSGMGVSGGNFDPSIAGIGTHNIFYTFTDTNSCINSDTSIVTVQLCTGVDNISNDFGILIYPNPNTGLFTIEKPNGLNMDVHVKLLDVTSKQILEKVMAIEKQKVDIDITKYSKGIYYLQLIVNDEVFVKQILKN